MSHPGPQGFPGVIRHYQLERTLGSGGMGSVVQGVDRRDGTAVAIKLLHPHLAASDDSFRERFEQEAHIAALLRSPFTVHLLDFGVQDGLYYLVMEYIEGETAEEALRHGPMEPRVALRIASEAAKALEEAAARGIVHRDVKPANLLLDQDGRVKLADFGIARQHASKGLTITGAFVGTPAYAAPEQIAGEADQRTDVYQLGATLYHLLAGHPPFSGGSTGELLRMHQEAPVPVEPLAQLPRAVRTVVTRAMEKDPLDRYQTMGEMVGALDRARNALTAPATGGAAAQRPAAGTASAVIGSTSGQTALPRSDLATPPFPPGPRGRGALVFDDDAGAGQGGAAGRRRTVLGVGAAAALCAALGVAAVMIFARGSGGDDDDDGGGVVPASTAGTSTTIGATIGPGTPSPTARRSVAAQPQVETSATATPSARATAAAATSTATPTPQPPTATFTPTSTPTPTPTFTPAPAAKQSISFTVAVTGHSEGGDNSSNYTFVVTNTGSVEIDGSELTVQSWYSADSKFDGTAIDCGAAGARFSGTIVPGGSWSGSFFANYAPEPQFWAHCVDLDSGWIIVEIHSRSATSYLAFSATDAYPVSRN